MAAGVLPDAIRVQGEQGQTTAANEPGYKTALSFTTPAFSATDDAQMGAFVNEGWRIKSDYADSERNAWGTTQNLPQREEARGVDIYVVCDEAAVTSTERPAGGACRVRCSAVSPCASSASALAASIVAGSGTSQSTEQTT